jgi:peptide/nickel transport system permease protein
MIGFILRRLTWVLAMIFFVSAITFGLIFASPGDPALLLIGARPGFQRDETLLPQVRKRYNLDEPVHIQYLKYMSNVVRGEFGYSYFYKRSVGSLLFEKFPNTALLAGVIMLVSLLIGLPLGVLVSAYRNTWLDKSFIALTTVIISIPPFFFALLLIFVFAFRLQLVPTGGYGSLRHLILPVFSVATSMAVSYALFLRTNMLTLFDTEFARTARAKGLLERTVAMRHVLPNALLPIVTLASIDLAFLLTGIVLIERVFNWPGIGLVVSRAAEQKDIPVILGSVMFGALLIGVGNLIADVLAARMDPRIKLR